MHRCKYCGGQIRKSLIGWHHVCWTSSIHIPRPSRKV